MVTSFIIRIPAKTNDYLVSTTLTAPPVILSLMTEEEDLGQTSESSEASLPLQIVR